MVFIYVNENNIRSLPNINSLGRLYIESLFFIKGLAYIIVSYKFMLEASSRSMIALLLAALYLGGLLAHGSHLHTNTHDLSVSECSMCSFSSATVANAYLDSFPMAILGMAYALPMYFSPTHHIDVSVHGTRAPPLTMY